MSVTSRLVENAVSTQFFCATSAALVLSLNAPARAQNVTHILEINYNLSEHVKDTSRNISEFDASYLDIQNNPTRSDDESVRRNITIRRSVLDRQNFKSDHTADYEANIPGPVLPNESDNLHYQIEMRDADAKWRKMMRINGRLEILYQALNAVDLGETLYCLDRHICQEDNPILGRHPSNATLIAVKSLTAVAHYAAYSWLKDNAKLTKIFEITTVAIQGGVVIWNATIAF